MIDAIATMPISPRANPKIMFLLSQFITDILGRITNQEIIFAFNILDRDKNKQVNKICSFGSYQKIIQGFGLVSKCYWRDDLAIKNELIKLSIERLIGDENAKILETDVLCCPCGAVDMMAESFSLREGKVFATNGKEVWCQICHEKIERISCMSIVLKINSNNALIYPHGLMPRVLDTINNIKQYPWRISRLHKTGRLIKIGGEEFHIDIDYCWMLFTLALKTDGIMVNTLVASARSMRKALIVSTLSNYFGVNIKRIVFHPYAMVKESDNQNILLAKSVLERYGSNVARLFLSLGFNWSSIEHFVSSREIFWIIKTMGKLLSINNHTKLSQGDESIEWVIQQLDCSRIKCLLDNARKNQISLFRNDLKVLNILLRRL